MRPIEQLAVVNYRKRFGPSAAGLKICYDLLQPLQKKIKVSVSGDTNDAGFERNSLNYS